MSFSWNWTWRNYVTELQVCMEFMCKCLALSTTTETYQLTFYLLVIILILHHDCFSLTKKHPSQFQWPFWVRHYPYALPGMILGSMLACTFRKLKIFYIRFFWESVYITFDFPYQKAQPRQSVWNLGTVVGKQSTLLLTDIYILILIFRYWWLCDIPMFKWSSLCWWSWWLFLSVLRSIYGKHVWNW